jgi:glycosyltransferase involved in cell wall biosynthesis
MVRQREADLRAVGLLDGIIANSPYTAACIKKIYDCDARSCYFGIPQSLGVTEIQAPEPYALAIGRLEPYKNFIRLFEAVDLLKAQKNWPEGFCLKVVGQGPLETLLKRFVQAKGLQNHIQLKGFVTEAELKALMSAAAFGIFVPLDEPMGLIPMEMGACGRACIPLATLSRYGLLARSQNAKYSDLKRFPQRKLRNP